MRDNIPSIYHAAWSWGLPANVRAGNETDVLAYKLWNKAKHGDEKAASELAYLARFNTEWCRGWLKGGKDAPGTLHNTPEMARDVWNRNTARRRDISVPSKHNPYKNGMVSYDDAISSDGEIKSPK